MEHVMVIVPVDADIDETQDIAQKHRQHWFQCPQVDLVRHFQFQHHDGDDDGENTVTERFQPILLHESTVAKRIKSVALISGRILAWRGTDSSSAPSGCGGACF
jgi:hypothetical protein